jgi:catechol 2,3-dioxygenase-like lactoylglutathione lyase family enzyme
MQEDVMLGDARVAASIPVLDLERSKAFYRDVLGLRITEDTPFGAFFAAGDGTGLLIFPRADVAREHTMAGFEVDDLETTMKALEERGVTFDEVDLPGIQQGGKVAQLGPVRSAWFRDSEGNVLAVTERVTR